MAHDIAVTEIPARRLERAPGAVRAAGVILLVLGVVAFVAALGADAERAWRAYQVNWLFFTSVAQGAVLLSAVVAMAKGLWSRPIRRFALSFVAFLPISFLLFLPLFFAADKVLPWVADPAILLHGKEKYLNMPFLVTRNVLFFGALVVVDLLFAYWALRPDIGLVRDDAPAKLRGLYAWFTRDWQGQDGEEARAHRRVSVLAPVLALLHAFALSFVVFDFVMSLEPNWWSTLLGPYFFMAAFLGGVVATGLVALIYRARLGLEEVIGTPSLHDLGKLTFALCIFWAYTMFAQLLPIWYGLLPMEQSFLVHRLGRPFGPIAVAVLLCLWALPFFGLLSAAAKKTPAVYGTFAVIVLLGLWLERYLLVYPSHYWQGAEIPLGWQEVGIGLGFAGLLVLAHLWFVARFPIFQLWQPLSELELSGLEEPPGTISATAE